MTSDSVLSAGVVAMTNVCNLVRVRALFHYSDLHVMAARVRRGKPEERTLRRHINHSSVELKGEKRVFSDYWSTNVEGKNICRSQLQQ